MAILCLEIVAAFWAVGSAIYKVYYDSDSKIYRWSIGFLIGFGVLEIIVANLSTKKGISILQCVTKKCCYSL